MVIQIRPVISKEGLRYVLFKRSFLRFKPITYYVGYDTYDYYVYKTVDEAVKSIIEMFGTQCTIQYYWP